MSQLSMPISLADQQHLVLTDVSWGFYKSLLEEIDARPLRVTFARGRLEIMPPLPIHEGWKKRIGLMIELVCMELEIPVRMLGNATFRRDDLEVGLEPDECYYLAHFASVRGKPRIDLSIDPPPDLAVEIDITRRSIPRQPIYASLGIPELWRFDGKRLIVLVLTQAGSYEECTSSPAFPFLPMDEFRGFLELARDNDETATMRAFQKWVRTLSK